MKTTMTTTQHNNHRRLATATLSLAILVLAACGDDGGDGGGGTVIVGDGSTTSVPDGVGTGTTYAHPTGADEVVLQVFTGGGYVPVETSLREMPSFSLYGDGRLVVTGAQIAIYPGPALTPLFESRLTEDQIQQVLAGAADAGLIGADEEINFGEPEVTDRASTTVTIAVADEVIVHSVYALGLDEEDANVTSRQWEARTRLQDFLGGLSAFESPDATPYVPDELAVYIAAYAAEPPPDVRLATVVWPLATDLAAVLADPGAGGAAGFACLAISGPDVSTLVEVVTNDANEITPWLATEGSDTAYQLVFRPMLPNETACAQ
jgi:hypothetical protein